MVASGARGVLLGLVDDAETDRWGREGGEGVEFFQRGLHGAFVGEVGGDDDGDELGVVGFVLVDGGDGDLVVAEDLSDAGEDAGPPFDAGDDFRDFLAALDGTVWSGLAERDGVFRGFEMQFVGGGSPMWGEIRNPYGPARQRIRRFLRPTLDGCSSPTVCTVSTTISR